jgi:hypothetical protein
VELGVNVKEFLVNGVSYDVADLAGSHVLTFKNVGDLLSCVKSEFRENIL